MLYGAPAGQPPPQLKSDSDMLRQIQKKHMFMYILVLITADLFCNLLKK